MNQERETDITTNLDESNIAKAPQPDGSVPYLVVLAGESVGRVIRLHPDSTMVAGRSRSCDVFIDCSNISRRHATFELDVDAQTTVVDLGSTNGTLVNGKKVDRSLLHDGDRVCFGNVILRYSQKDGLEFDFQKKLYDKATKDVLTGAFNKRYFLEALNKEFSFHSRRDAPLSLIMMDLDDFKKINDTYGHVNGDIVLKSLASELLQCLRREDLLARFGGEEFVVIFRDTHLEEALSVARKLMDLVNSLSFETLDASFGIGVTMGVATYYKENYTSPDDLLMAADRNLYVGKKEGKGRIIG